MLGIAGAHADCSGISVCYLDIEIADRGIEGARVCIRRSGARGGASSGEEDHVRGALLKCGCIWCENQRRPGIAKSDQANSGPDIDCSREPVSARRNKQDPLIRLFLNLVDGLLKRGRVVSDSVALHGKIVRREIDGAGVVEPCGVVRDCEEWHTAAHPYSREKSLHDGDRVKRVLRIRKATSISRAAVDNFGGVRAATLLDSDRRSRP